MVRYPQVEHSMAHTECPRRQRPPPADLSKTRPWKFRYFLLAWGCKVFVDIHRRKRTPKSCGQGGKFSLKQAKKNIFACSRLHSVRASCGPARGRRGAGSTQLIGLRRSLQFQRKTRQNAGATVILSLCWFWAVFFGKNGHFFQNQHPCRFRCRCAAHDQCGPMRTKIPKFSRTGFRQVCLGFMCVPLHFLVVYRSVLGSCTAPFFGRVAGTKLARYRIPKWCGTAPQNDTAPRQKMIRYRTQK